MADIREISALLPQIPIKPGESRRDRQRQPREEPPKRDNADRHDNDDGRPHIDEFA